MAAAGMTLPNAASEEFHRAMGFRPVGVFERIGFKHGRWHDVAWTQRRLAVTDSPSPR
jgi:L-amino acid N-acyltransferase YncA